MRKIFYWWFLDMYILQGFSEYTRKRSKVKADVVSQSVTQSVNSLRIIFMGSPFLTSNESAEDG